MATTSKKITAVFLALLCFVTMFTFCASAAAKVNISKCDVSYKAEQTYTGKAIKPGIKVVYKNKTLKSGTDYSVAYSNNTKVGTGTIKVTGKGGYTGSVNYKFTIKVASVTGLTAIPSATSVKLTWKKATGASKYEITYKTGSASATVKTTSSTSYTISKLKANTKYTITVATVNKDGKKSAKVSKSVTTKLATPAVTAEKIDTASIKLSWKAVSGATSYTVYKYTSADKKYTKLGTTTAKTYMVKSLKANTKYSFAVAATSKSNSSAKSAVVSRATGVATPAQVKNLKASAISSKQINLSWDKVSGVTGYNIYKFENGAYTKLTTSSTNSYTVSGLKANTRYYYAVSAYKKGLEETKTGSKSAKVSAQTKDSNELNAFLAIAKDGDMTVNYKVVADQTTVNGKVAIKGKNCATQNKTTIEGLTMTMNTTFDGKSGYVWANASGIKVYQKLNEKQAKENALDAEQQRQLFYFEPKDGAYITKGNQTFNGKACTTYTFQTTNNNYATYYFNGGKCQGVTCGGETITITSYSNSVASDAFKTPSFTLYLKMDIL